MTEHHVRALAAIDAGRRVAWAKYYAEAPQPCPDDAGWRFLKYGGFTIFFGDLPGHRNVLHLQSAIGSIIINLGQDVAGRSMWEMTSDGPTVIHSMPDPGHPTVDGRCIPEISVGLGQPLKRVGLPVRCLEILGDRITDIGAGESGRRSRKPVVKRRHRGRPIATRIPITQETRTA